MACVMRRSPAPSAGSGCGSRIGAAGDVGSRRRLRVSSGMARRVQQVACRRRTLVQVAVNRSGDYKLPPAPRHPCSASVRGCRCDRLTLEVVMDSDRSSADAGPALSLSINGRTANVPASAQTVADLVVALGLTGKRIAIERNGEVVPRSLHAATALARGDRIEIVGAVGGG